jgi:hypothetical protein
MATPSSHVCTKIHPRIFHIFLFNKYIFRDLNDQYLTHYKAKFVRLTDERSFNYFDRSHMSRYDNVTLSPLLLQLGLRIGPIQRMGAN